MKVGQEPLKTIIKLLSSCVEYSILTINLLGSQTKRRHKDIGKLQT